MDLMALDNLRDPQSLAIAWTEPVMPNGNIESYDVQYRGISSVNTVSSNFSQVQMLSVASTMALLQNLVPFSIYNISVRASTGAGPGPFSAKISVRTLEDGECLHRPACALICVCAYACMHKWTCIYLIEHE